MGGRGVDRYSDNVLRELILVVESGPEVDAEALDRSVRQLRAEFEDLNVESIALPSSGEAPLGAKGIDPVTLGTLLISLTAAGGVFTGLIETARDWLARQAGARRISVTIDGDTIVLEKGSAKERSALIEAYMRRHGVE